MLLEHWREAKGLSVGVTAQEGRRALQPAALWLHEEQGRTKAGADELSPHIEPVLKSIHWSGGSAKDFLHAIRDESGLLTGWDQERYGFMHLGFQEYLAAREIRSRAFKDPGILKELAARFGESWWREVGLLLLALEDPSLFEPYMREVVKTPTFASHLDIVEACLDDAAETSALPFIELLKTEGGDSELWNRQLAALRVLDRLDPEALEGLHPKLSRHASPEIIQWIHERVARESQAAIVADKGGYKLVYVPGGVFMMGAPKSEEGRYDEEGPLREVSVSPFYMGRYPVTNEEYEKYLTENPDAEKTYLWSAREYNQPRQPIVGVSWDGARRYANWAGLRLPTEAEWEYACRAGTTTRYYTGDTEEDLDRAGWYVKNSDGKLHVVGEKRGNEFGLYDMHGNVSEWVEDDWHGNYRNAPDDERAWVVDPRAAARVYRGGSWDGDARFSRSAFRYNNSPYTSGHYLGFRLSRSLTLGP